MSAKNPINTQKRPELHLYQKKAVRFGLQQKQAFFAIDLGLGKTAIALYIIKISKQPTVVFAPRSVIFNTWPAEISLWAPELTYEILHGPDKDFLLERALKNKVDILLINYSGIKWFSQAIPRISMRVKFTKRTLILDESSKIKSPSTQRFKLLKRMGPLWSDYRFCLSATPMSNGYHELWTQYFILDRGKTLGTAFTRFRGLYFNYMGAPVFKTTIKPKADKEINKLIRPITFRLDVKDYSKVKEPIYNSIKLQLDSPQFKQYKELETEFCLEFSAGEVTAWNAASLSNKLRQYVQGALYTDVESEFKGERPFMKVHNKKIMGLLQVIEAINGQSLLCPINFKFEYKMICEALGTKVPIIAGRTSVKEANMYIELWNAREIPLLLCHPASISHGLNLQRGGHNILWFSIPWSLDQYKQLNGRLIRQGQKEIVVVNHLVIKNTIDERIVSVLSEKDASQRSLLWHLRNYTKEVLMATTK